MITISEATPADYRVIQQIAYKTWPHTYGQILSKPQLDYMLDLFYSIEALTISVSEKGHRFLLAHDQTRRLGFLSYENNYQQRAVTRIHKIYVLPELQGGGIGKLLIAKVIEIAMLHQSAKLSLNVNRQNVAREFYTKLGFKVVGEEDVPIGYGYLMEDYIMEKDLFVP